MPSQQVIGIALFLVVVGVGFFVWWEYEKRRRAALQVAADEMGFTFTEKDETKLGSMPRSFELFDRGRARKFRNILTGRIADINVVIFDYQYKVGSGKNSSTYRMTVAAFHVASLNVPQFEIRPENVFHKIGTKFGKQDINFAEHPEFSKKFLLRGEDEEAVRALFTPDTIETFMKDHKRCAETRDTWFLTYRQGKRVKPDDMHAFLEEGYDICVHLLQ